MPLRELSRGEVVAGRYEVFRVLARGRTGVVYAAENKSVGRPCALEVIAPDGDAPPSTPAFLEAMRAVGRIGTHPNVAEFFDAGSIDELNTAYLAMELVEGQPIDAYTREKRCLPKVVGQLLVQVGGALEIAHQSGVVHGQLSPDNVLVLDGAEPVAKVLDFGVATALGIASGFAAPEQLGDDLRAEAKRKGFDVADVVGPAADVFGLGLLAYCLFTGSSITDHWGTEDVAEMNRRLATTPRGTASQRAGVNALKLPPGFDAWFERATAFHPAKRHPSAAEAVKALAQITGAAGVVVPLGTQVSSSGPTAPGSNTTLDRTPFAATTPPHEPDAAPSTTRGQAPPPQAPPPAETTLASETTLGSGPSPLPEPEVAAPVVTLSSVPPPNAPPPPAGTNPQAPPQWGAPPGGPPPGPSMGGGPAPFGPPPPSRTAGGGAAILIGAIVLGLMLVVGSGAAYMLLSDASDARTSRASDDDDDGRSSSKKKKKKAPTPTLASVPTSHTTASVPVFSRDPHWGDHGAPATLVMFSDYECPYCSRADATIDALKKKYTPSELRVVWKDFPLPFHKKAIPAHEAARAVFKAGGDAAFWTFHREAFTNQKDLTQTNFEAWAKKAGVGTSALSTHSAAASREVEDNINLGKSLGVRGTPAFYINGKFLSGARPQSVFEAEIDAEITAAKSLLSSGTPAADVYPTRTNKNYGPAPVPKPTPIPSPSSTVSTDVWNVPVGKDDPVLGPADALVTIVEFGDFQCPFCDRVRKTLKQVRADYPSDVRIVWKDHPLSFHKRAMPAAIVGREAYSQKGNTAFWLVHDLMFDGQKNLEDSDLEGYAAKALLDVKQVEGALRANRHKSFIDDSIALAADVDATGTPTFFINGRKLRGAQSYSSFKPVIDTELSKAKALVAGGTPASKVYAEIIKGGKGGPSFDEKNIGKPPPDAPFKGNPKGSVIIQVFSDFQCPFCSRVNPTIEDLIKANPDVKVVWRHHPLPFHKDAPLAHEAAMEAYAQKGNAGFWAMHDKLFDNRNALQRSNLEKYAADIGLDMTKFRRALDTHKHQARVEQDNRDAKTHGIRGTPSFVVGRFFISGAQPLAKFQRLVEHARKNP